MKKDSQSRFGKGQGDLRQHREMVRSIESRRLVKALGHGLKGGPKNNHIVNTEHSGYDHGPDGIGQAQFLDYQEGGNHTAAEEHSENDKQHDGFL